MTGGVTRGDGGIRCGCFPQNLSFQVDSFPERS